MSSTRKVAIVTGASQGIGAGIVQGFRDRLYRIVATSRSIKVSADEHMITIAGDIADPDTADRVINAAIDRFGRIDTLVNNAGVFVAMPFTQYSQLDFASVVSTNLGGFFRMTQLALQEMEGRGSGHVVNITASLADHARSVLPAAIAAMTKGGLNAVTKSLAIEYAGRGIRVNAVAPGVVKTAMHSELTHAALASFHPVGRIGEIADIVAAVLYLESAPFVTGEILHVDGGESAGTEPRSPPFGGLQTGAHALALRERSEPRPAPPSLSLGAGSRRLHPWHLDIRSHEQRQG